MLRRILSDAAEVRFEDVIAIKKRHFTIRLNPDLKKARYMVLNDVGPLHVPYILHIARDSLAQ